MPDIVVWHVTVDTEQTHTTGRRPLLLRIPTEWQLGRLVHQFMPKDNEVRFPEYPRRVRTCPQLEMVLTGWKRLDHKLNDRFLISPAAFLGRMNDHDARTILILLQRWVPSMSYLDTANIGNSSTTVNEKI
jgi:hypothetical protein